MYKWFKILTIQISSIFPASLLPTMNTLELGTHSTVSCMASLHFSMNNSIKNTHPIFPTWKSLKFKKTLFPYSNKSLHFSSKSFKVIIRASVSSLPFQDITKDKINQEEEEEDIQEMYHRPLNQIWREIQGSNNWEGLLDPMNSHLRKEILRYGDFAQACYDSFDFDPHSKYCGTCKYQGAHFFEKLGMVDKGYHMRRFIYATSNINLPKFFQKSTVSSIWSQHANWMGYVAITTDEDEIKRLGRRDILIAWRGTVTYLEWIHDLKNILHPAHFRDDPSIKIESGFFDLYTAKEDRCEYCSYSAREQVLAEISRLIQRYKNEELSITITGHSLGAALALLSAYDVAEMNANIVTNGNNNNNTKESIKKIPITVYSFSGPRVGNLKFKERCDELGIKVIRIVNVHDTVPKVPGIITNEKFQYQKYIEDAISFPWSYAHVGVELGLDHTWSRYLKPTADIVCAHNLEALLHLVDGYHGKEKGFKSATNRDIALVNKCCNFLKKEYGVPANWRQDENKGMVRTIDGRWVLPDRPRVEAHPPDTAHLFQRVIRFARSGFEHL